MPDEDGYPMMKRLRQIEHEQGIARVPAIAVTAFARNEDRQRPLTAGFDDQLPKPLNPDLLMTTIARLTRAARLGQLAFDIRFRTIRAGRYLIVPVAFAVFPGDGCRLARFGLLFRRALRGAARFVM